MDRNKIIKAIDFAIAGLNELKSALCEGGEVVVTEEVPTTSTIDTNLLATRLAYAYTTRHPEYKVESQFGNLKDMIQTDKISFVVAWMRKGNIEGLESFFQLDGSAKRAELNKALTLFEKEIKDIFTQRFSSTK